MGLLTSKPPGRLLSVDTGPGEKKESGAAQPTAPRRYVYMLNLVWNTQLLRLASSKAAVDLVVVRRENRSARSPSRCCNGTHLCDKLHLSQIMRLTITVFVFLILGGTRCIHAERSNSTAKTLDPVTRKLFIDPSSTSVALGKASLIVSPLTHRGGNYVGTYQLKVRPYYFKSEKGTLLLAASDDSVRKLQVGTAINFTGKAVTRKDGKTHVVLGKATPSSGDRGSVTFSIITDNGKMVFNTSYHFGT